MTPATHRSRGQIEQLPSGSWRSVVYAGQDPLTRRRRYLKETSPSLADAKVALTRLQREVDEELHPKSSITVERAVEAWLEVADLAATTRERYDDLIRIYIRPTFGELPAAKLDAELLERFYARLLRCRSMCTGRPSKGHACRGLSSSTVRKIHFIINAALERAVRWRHLSVNKASFAAVPAPPQTEPDPPTPEEAARLLEEAWTTDPDWGVLLWLTMVSGSRRGEMSALRWRHIDLERGLMLVQRSNAQPRSGEVLEKQTKTRQQRRIALDPQTVELLAEHRSQCEERLAALGCELDDELFVFSQAPDHSLPWSPRALTHRYYRMAKKLKLRSTRLHSLRHYSATELIAAGVDIRTVAGRLGHGSGGATTLKIYAAWVDEAGQRAAEAMGGIMPKIVIGARPVRGPYETIASVLREQIFDGRLSVGAQLPTTGELAKVHAVSPATVHRAFSVLRNEGLIDVARGHRAKVIAVLAEG